MDHDELLARYDRQMRRQAPADGPGARVERVGDVVRHIAAPGDGEGDGWNGIIWSDLDDSTADAAIAEQLRYFDSLECGFEWKVYGHDRPGDLANRLLAAGFEADDEETLLVADTHALAADTGAPAGLVLREVNDAAGVDLAVRVQEQVFGRDASGLRGHLLAQLATPRPTTVAVLAMAGGEPVASSRVDLPVGRDFAGLYGGGTLAEWRGRGVYRAMVHFRARIAAARGHRFLQVDALPTSRPTLQRLGFTALSTTTPYVHRLGASAQHSG
ncbi:GNAT family N-acetyltransferase [Streptomyces sp. SCSIO 30461]|uniref:GNAT family N-acetyltransferase n=1 Tax=Streptomyces sp. SCSIO 30461 TaxID=3118085 RepID=UPI0030D2F3A3